MNSEDISASTSSAPGTCPSNTSKSKDIGYFNFAPFVLTELGVLHARYGHLSDALTSFDSAIQHLQTSLSSLSPDSPRTHRTSCLLFETKKHMATSLMESGATIEAAQLFGELACYYREGIYANPVLLSDCNYHLARLLNSMGRFDLAEPVIRECVEIRRTLFGQRENPIKKDETMNNSNSSASSPSSSSSNTSPPSVEIEEKRSLETVQALRIPTTCANAASLPCLGLSGFQVYVPKDKLVAEEAAKVARQIASGILSKPPSNQSNGAPGSKDDGEDDQLMINDDEDMDEYINDNDDTLMDTSYIHDDNDDNDTRSETGSTAMRDRSRSRSRVRKGINPNVDDEVIGVGNKRSNDEIVQGQSATQVQAHRQDVPLRDPLLAEVPHSMSSMTILSADDGLGRYVSESATEIALALLIMAATLMQPAIAKFDEAQARVEEALHITERCQQVHDNNTSNRNDNKADASPSSKGTISRENGVENIGTSEVQGRNTPTTSHSDKPSVKCQEARRAALDRNNILSMLNSVASARQLMPKLEAMKQSLADALNRRRRRQAEKNGARNDNEK